MRLGLGIGADVGGGDFFSGGTLIPSGVKCHTFIRAALLLDMFTACLSSSSREYNAARLAV